MPYICIEYVLIYKHITLLLFYIMLLLLSYSIMPIYYQCCIISASELTVKYRHTALYTCKYHYYESTVQYQSIYHCTSFTKHQLIFSRKIVPLHRGRHRRQSQRHETGRLRCVTVHRVRHSRGRDTGVRNEDIRL